MPLTQFGTYASLSKSVTDGQFFTGTQQIKDGYLRLTSTNQSVPPEVHIESARAGVSWIFGIDVSNHGGAYDYVPVAKGNPDGTVEDLFYWSYNNVGPINAPTAATATTGGTLAAGTKGYVITATNASGETAASPEVQATTTGSTGTVTLTWVPSVSATGYKIYGRTPGGPWTLLATLSGQAPTPTAQGWATWTDTGANTPDGVTNAPSTTTGTWSQQTATAGLGVTPPNRKYRFQVAGKDTETWLGGISVRVGLSQTGYALSVVDSSGADRLWVEGASGAPLLNGNHTSYGSGIAIQRAIFANTSVNSSPIVVKAPSGQNTQMALFQLNGVSKTGVSLGGLFQWIDSALESTTVGAAGAAAALPASPTKYLLVKDSTGTTLKIPAFS